MSFKTLIDAELAAVGAFELDLFDIHAHTGADIDGSARSAAEHADALARFNGRSAIFPFCVEGSYEPENSRVVDEAQRHSDQLVPFARLNPNAITTAADVEAALAQGARGIKLHPRSESFTLQHPGVETILGVAAAARAPVLIHAGVGVGSFGPQLLELADRHRDCPIILAHAAVSDLAWLGGVAAEYPNLLFDTSWWNPSDLLALFAQVPPGQILFGSDEPYMNLEAVLAVALRCARFTGLSAEAIALVFGGQASALLAGDELIDAGPAPGMREAARTANQSRLATMLAATGGCLIGGGDPTNLLELTQLAVGPDEAKTPVGQLIEALGASPQDAPWALAIALAHILAPELERSPTLL